LIAAHGAPRARILLEAARPRTLVAGAVPVVVGTASAGRVVVWRAAAALVVALSLQVAVNFANDLFDALKGVDAGDRVGPRRAVAAGVLSRRHAAAAIAASLFVAAAAGGSLALAVGPELLFVGAACIVAALAYSGGPRPYGSAALGEVFVFVFFGVVATVGSAYVQTGELEPAALAAALPIGFLASAMLVANNLRDIASDRRAGKHTLAVVLGAGRTRALFGALVTAAFAGVGLVALVSRSPWPLLGALALPAAVAPLRLMRAADPAALIGALVATARLELVLGGLLATGLWLAR
jgi:1,4-dihydroxy-2-naphthoate octaprenyltransferase